MPNQDITAIFCTAPVNISPYDHDRTIKISETECKQRKEEI